MDPVNSLYQMDESKDVNPTVCLEGKILMLSGITNPAVGDTFDLDCTAKVTSIKSEACEDGTTCNCVCLELSRITIDMDDNQILSQIYPTMRKM